MPGLLAAGIGTLIFIGLDAWTGLGTFSLSIPGLPHVGSPTGAEFLWALAIGILAVLLGSGIRWLGLFLRPHVEGRMLLAMPVVGLAIAALAIAFAEATGKGSSLVLFSGQSALGRLVTHGASYTVGTLVLLIVCKGLAYGGSLSSFRGGPTFPAMFLGAAGRHGTVAPARTAACLRRRHGHRRDDRSDAQAPADLGPARHSAPGLRRPVSHAAGDRGGRGGVRGLGAAGPSPGGIGPGGPPSPAGPEAPRPAEDAVQPST